MADHRPRVAVVGAGVTGLTAAYRLFRNGTTDVVVFDRAGRTGGQLRSVEVGGHVVDAGADSFPGRKESASELCRELRIETTRAAASGTWLWTPRGLVEYPSGTAFGIPADLGDLFRWPGLSGRGRRRAVLDLVKRKRPAGAGDETLGGLLRRRLGDEATDLALAPILGQPFGGAVDELSTEATFPELRAWERSQGSLLRGAQATVRDTKRPTPAPPLFVRPRLGVAAITDELDARLGSAVRPRASVDAVRRAGDGWTLDTSDGPEHADAIVVAVDAPTAGALLQPVAPDVRDDLGRIPNVSVGIVLLVYPKGTAGTTPMTSCTFTSSVWPDPSFGSRAVLRCAIGGAGQEDLVDADDADIVEACARHLAALIPLPERPEASAVVRWPGAIPRYLLGHVDRVARIRERLPAGIFVCGRSFDGLDVAGCIRGATETAERALSSVASTHRERIG